MSPEENENIEVILNDIIFLSYHNSEYKYLFHENPKRVELLNEIAGFFFSDYQRLLMNHICLTMAKLCDPPVQGRGKFRNFTLDYLVDVSINNKWNISKALTDKLAEIRTILNPITIFRNKFLAHRDWETAVRNGENLDPIIYKQIEISVKMIEDFYNIYSINIRKSQFSFKMTGGRDAKSLISWLKMGRHYPEIVKDDWEMEMQQREKWKYKDA
jgi:hypothetical protein